MLYDNLLRLCNEKGVSLSRVCVENGINKSTATAWKKGGGITPATLKKLADYFGVTASDLLGEETKKDPAPDGAESKADVFMNLYASLSPEQQAKVEAFAKFLQMEGKE